MARFIDPFSEMQRVLDSMGGPARSGALMPMDAYEKNGMYTLRFDLPGADPSKVDLSVESGVLTVTAERPSEDTEGVNWLIRERPTGTHSRQIRLGSSLDTNRIEANYDHGVLTVTVPIREEQKPQRIQIGTGHPKATDT